MIQVHVTYQFESGIPYAAASVNAPVKKLDDALEYAYRWTQNIEDSWSNKGPRDGNDNVSVLHYNFDGSGLRSSMIGDEFMAEGKIFEVSSFGFKEIINFGIEEKKENTL